MPTVSTRLLVRSAAIALAALLAGASCAPAATAVPAPASPEPGAADALTLMQLERLWADTGEGGGGYRSTTNLVAAPSLYLTSWTLRLIARYHTAVPQLSQAETATWLRTILDQPDNPADALPPLQRAWLAGQALVALNEAVPTAPVARFLPTLRAGDRYRYGPQQSASWPATQTAVELMQMAGVSVPSEIADSVTAQLPLVSDPARASRLDDLQVLETILPVWQLADLLLPDSSRAPFPRSLRPILTALTARAGAAGVSGPLAAALLINAQQISLANGIELPAGPPPASLALTTPDGFVSASAAKPMADPQLTYDAALLGMPADDRLLTTIRRTAGPLGWQANAGPVDPQTTFDATVVTHALGHHEHDGALRPLTLTWLGQLPSDSSATSTTASAPQLRAAFFVLALARELGVPIPSSIAAWLRESMTAAANPGQLSRESWFLRMGEAAGVTPPDEVWSSVRQTLLHLDVRNMQDVYALQVGAEAGRDSTLKDRAVTGARQLALGAVYRFTPGSPSPDVRSTSLGIAIVGASPAARQQAIRPFSSAEGIWMFPTTQSGGNVLDPESIYLGYVVLGRTANAAGIFFYE